MILDATAGYRTMYELKDTPNIIYIDVETKLLTKPTIFCDNTKTPFMDKQFNTIFYDPPHGFGEKQFDHINQMMDRIHTSKVKLPYSNIYYGWDKYSNQQSLIIHVYKAQREFNRILKDDGLLWVKWNECRISLRRILQVCDMFDVLMRLPVSDPAHNWGKSKTWWIVLIKKKREFKQCTLS